MTAMCRFTEMHKMVLIKHFMETCKRPDYQYILPHVYFVHIIAYMYISVYIYC